MTNAELIKKIEDSDEWILEDCKEACKRAGLDEEWEKADGENFEKVVYKALDILEKRMMTKADILRDILNAVEYAHESGYTSVRPYEVEQQLKRATKEELLAELKMWLEGTEATEEGWY